MGELSKNFSFPLRAFFLRLYTLKKEGGEGGKLLKQELCASVRETFELY